MGNNNYNNTKISINHSGKSRGGDVIRAITKAREKYYIDDYDLRVFIDEVIKRNKTTNYSLMKAIYSIIDAREKYYINDYDLRVRIEEAVKNVR